MQATQLSYIHDSRQAVRTYEDACAVFCLRVSAMNVHAITCAEKTAVICSLAWQGCICGAVSNRLPQL